MKKILSVFYSTIFLLFNELIFCASAHADMRSESDYLKGWPFLLTVGVLVWFISLISAALLNIENTSNALEPKKNIEPEKTDGPEDDGTVR